MAELEIGGRRVGRGEPCFVIAEIGTNHGRALGRARELVRAAAEAGADGVKFQLYEADDIVSRRIAPAEYGLEALYPGMTMHEAFDRCLRTPREWFPELSAYAASLGLTALATAHSGAGATFIAEQGMAAVKVASMDLTNLPVLRDIAAASRLPVLFSTGLSTLAEIDRAAAVFREAGSAFGILHCVSNYPARPEELHLQNIPVLARAYGVPVGFSDHTLTPLSSVVAVTLGARVIEKHITLDRSAAGPDHPFALEPADFAELVRAVRQAELCFEEGAAFTGPSEREAAKRRLYRRSLVAARTIPAGRALTAEDVKITRPGTGIEPAALGLVLGRAARVEIEADTPLDWSML